MQQIEVEIRGKIEPKKFEWLKSYLEKNGNLKKRKKQLVFYYYLPNETQLRLHCDKNRTVLSTKTKSASDNIRKEIEVDITIGEVKDMIDLLTAIGIQNPLVLFKEQWIFDHNGYEFSLEDLEGWGATYEIEALCGQEESAKTEKEIINLANELELHITDGEEIKKLLKEYRNGYNATALTKIGEYLKQIQSD